MIEYVLSSSQKQIEEIVVLQKQNFPENLSKEERESDGFVTVKHTVEQLLQWQKKQPHILAVSEGKVIGYALCMLAEFKDDVPVLIPMFEKIEASIDSSISYLVMGQVCVDKDFRGKGVFRGLYDKMKASCDSFDWIITEVDTSNIRSMKAHEAVGFKELITYKYEKHIWSLIYLDL